MVRQIKPEDARIGMYIRGFGGSWFDHPFWLAKFVLKTQHDLDRVRQSGVPYLLIDDELGIAPITEIPADATASARRIAAKPRPVPAIRPHNMRDEQEQSRKRSERKRAKALVAKSRDVLRNAFADIRLGRAIRMKEVAEIVDDVVDTVERNPHTLLEVLRLKKKNEYTYLHSVAVCTLMVNAARHLGKGIDETRDYGLAGLLHDLGKMGIPDSILDKDSGLTESEFLEVRNHPEYGYQLLSQAIDIPDMALDVCRHHHEKMDGTGYPFGLPADAISEVARLGAICDVYDALTSERTYKDAWSPAVALAAMWSWEGHFDRRLLFRFMQSVGVFPAGMPVQLRSNRLALVLEQKRVGSRPRVLAFYDTREREWITPEEIVLQDNFANDSIVGAVDPDDWGLADWDRIAAQLKNGEAILPAA